MVLRTVLRRTLEVECEQSYGITNISVGRRVEPKPMPPPLPVPTTADVSKARVLLHLPEKVDKTLANNSGVRKLEVLELDTTSCNVLDPAYCRTPMFLKCEQF